MKTASLLTLAVLATAFSFRVTASSVQENTVTLSPDEVQKCIEGGGCFVVSNKAVAEFAEGMKKKGLADCRNAL